MEGVRMEWDTRMIAEGGGRGKKKKKKKGGGGEKEREIKTETT